MNPNPGPVLSEHSYDAVLFVSFGGPERSEEILPFLERVTEGRGIPRERLLDVAEHYEHLGGRSPINEITRRQAAALEAELNRGGLALPVLVGQRYAAPFLTDALQEMARRGYRRVIGFCTAAHRSEASLERYVAATEAARAETGPSAPVVDFVDPWFDHPLFIEALCARVNEIVQPQPALLDAPWYFVAHSIPCGMAKASTYVPELERTASLVTQRFGKRERGLAFSSRSGRPQDPWLVPSLEEAIDREKARGASAILFITIGFIADHVEVLFDQDIEAKAHAERAGIAFQRTQTVGDHPLFVRLMAEVVRRRMASGQSEARQVSSAVGAEPSRCYCYGERADAPCRQTPPPRRVHG